MKMEKVWLFILLALCDRGKSEFDENGVYVPKYLAQKYDMLTHSQPQYENNPGEVNTYTKTKHKTVTKTGESPFSSYHKTKTGPLFTGGCTTQPPIPMNAGLRCSKYSGCRIDCIPNYKFPNDVTQLFVVCQEGKWIAEGVDWEHVPACEPICLPECQNNGICVAPNQCNCPENFSGPQCQYEHKPCLNYPPMPLNAKRVCRAATCAITCMPGHEFPDGSTITNMICKDGSWKPSRENWPAVPDCQAICDPPCLNGGNCLSFNVCQCPQDYRGPQCQYRADACTARKLQFNGGYNCNGDNNVFTCVISCPEGVNFEFSPAPSYTCSYDTGIFQPSPIPQCVFAPHVEVIPSGSYHTFHHVQNQSYSIEKLLENERPFIKYNFGNLQKEPIPQKLHNDTTINFVPVQPIDIGVAENQYVVVQEKIPEPGICFTWAGTHFKTFDGKVYSFDSKCAHVLVKDAVDNTFSITIQNSKDCQKNRAHCYRIVKIYFQEEEYILKHSDDGKPILSTPNKLLPIPTRKPGMRAEMSAHFIVILLDTVGVKIKWDAQQLVQVEVKENLWNRTEGLCGKIDGSISNDLQVRGNNYEPSNLVTAISSWQINTVEDTCDSVPTEQQICQGTENKESKSREAIKFCKKLLLDKRFAPCHKIMDVNILLDACQGDYCSCELEDPSHCACETISVYAKECLHKGVTEVAHWREEDVCPMNCTNGKVYMACGPSKAQPVCGASTEIYEEDGKCVEGCYCPQGTVLHESKCITKDECPCRLRGKSFPAGSSVPKECNTCTCSEGQWVCTQVSCGARCAAIGDPHYVTFDGKRFDFMGQCSYYLVKTENFSVEAENIACAGAISQAMNFPISVSSGLPSCTKTVTIKMAGQIIKLKQNHDLVINGQDVTKIPYNILGISIRAVSSIFLQVELPNGVDIWWDGFTRVYIDIPAVLHGKTMGLCGTFNNNQKDDFLTPENDIEQAVIPFANKWKTSEKCNDIPEKLLQDPCEVNIQNKATAEMYCKKLKSDLFTACHFYVDPEPFYHDCLYDMCSCETKISKCLCSILAAYAAECSRKGVKIDWRNNVRECGVHCPAGQQYQVCGNSCTRTCYDVATRSDCRPQCVEGCNCPQGQALNEQGECVPLGQCSCWNNGLEFPAGYKEVWPASKAPELCTCLNAMWNCKEANTMDKQVYPNAEDTKTMCKAADNLEFTICESPEPTTCKNMHSQELMSASVCHPGCQCKAGYVLDTKQKKCVLPTECPCHHGGRSYGENATVQSDCNTCVCKNGLWECSERQCTAECSAWGDSHFKTFDGKMYDYQGQCDYLLAKGFVSLVDSFEVIIQSVPCGSLGVTCSKSVIIKVGFGHQQETVTFTKDKRIPNNKSLNRLLLREKGLFVIAEASDLGFVVHWDKGTRVYVKIDPRWKNKVKGLCGNYNDNELDDFQTPSGGLNEVSVNIFGDSWKLQPYCPEAVEITNTCEERPDRRMWAMKQCGILKSPLFAPCHSEVPVDIYYNHCVFDSCACDQGGDCECLCTALAAYAQECNNRGVPIKWRSQALCPMQCDERCSQYSPCISTCPIQTCDNLLSKTSSEHCAEDTCIEGCEAKACPPGEVYLNSSLLECVPRSVCKIFCLEIDSVTYYEGDLMEQDDCHSCFCSRGKKTCKGQPCTTLGIFTTLPAVTHQNEQKLQCVTGWTDWINQDKTFETMKSMPKLRDREPLPDSLVLNIMKSGSKCNKTQMVDIECRTVLSHMSPKETGLDVECSLERGLICNAWKGEICPDFEIRVYCQCEATTTTTFEQTTVAFIANNSCDVRQPNQEHPLDCSKFYHCVMGLNGPELVEKTCGASMFYNPKTQVCDWPSIVEAIKPQCQESAKTVTTEQQHTTTPITTTSTEFYQIIEPKTPQCPPGQIHDPCVLQCDKMCLYYLHVIKERGFCEKNQKCEEGCRWASKENLCPSGMFWLNNQTCIAAHDCLCVSRNGKPIKPGKVFRESECEVCQCIDNYYICDKSLCATKHTEVTRTTTEKMLPLILPVVTVTPPKECSKNNFIDLIQGDSSLPDSAFSASSVMSSYLSPQNSRFTSVLPENSGGAWAPDVSNKDQYLQINLGRQEPIYGVKIKGSPLYNEYVTSYRVLYSPNGISFFYVSDKEKEPRLFRGSIDAHTAVEQLFDIPIEAEAVRINPQSWVNGISLRVELIGCGKMLSTITTPEYEFLTTVAPPEFHTKKPILCDDPLGLDNSKISMQQISVSSEFSSNFSKSHLKLSDTFAWQPLTNSPTEWIQFDFLEPRNITGIITKGGSNGWVTAYSIKYSSNEKQWNPILDSHHKEITFLGNFDSGMPQTNIFELPISARFVKIIPQQWHVNIQIRVEVLGCFLPYPEIETVVTTYAPESKCNYCNGIEPLNIELGACKCKENLWWDGEECVPQNQCPCVVGHMTYAVGSMFEKEDCSQCICKLGGVSHCTPKQCDKCEEGLQSVLTTTCACICKPCGENKMLCPNSNVCMNISAWCNGVKDCPDDEINCTTTTPKLTTAIPTEPTVLKLTAATQTSVKKCPPQKCPPGYKVVEKNVPKSEKEQSYLSPMFFKSGVKSKSPYTGIKTSKKEIRKTLPKPVKITAVSSEKSQNCPEYSCVSVKPLPPPDDGDKRVCPRVSCPVGFMPLYNEEVLVFKGATCPEYVCNRLPPPEAVCNITGRTFNTFDNTEYKYDICNHILVRDFENEAWDIAMSKNCTNGTCTRFLNIRYQNQTFLFNSDLTIRYDDYLYTVDQLKTIGSHTQYFSLSELGNALLFASQKYGFWVVWDKNNNAKIGVVRKLQDQIDGLCGYFNDVRDDDKRKPDGSQARTTVEFGDSWAADVKSEYCEVKTCPIHIQDKAWEMCNRVRDESFDRCSDIVNTDEFVSRCLEEACLCLEAAQSNNTYEEKCRCEILQSFVVDCLTADPQVDLADWRMQNDCPATCTDGLVYQDCYQRRCEPSCQTISDPQVCPKLPNLCFPGCYCPPGLLRKGDECIEPSACRDCECKLLPNLQYVTYDGNNFTVNGNCVYIMSRDEIAKNKKEHAFQVLITNAPCKNNEEKMCVGKVTILYEGHKIHIFYNYIKDKLKIIIDGEKLEKSEDIESWATVTETASKDIVFVLKKVLIEVQVNYPLLGVSVKAPSHKYQDHLEGLCGNCNENPYDDFRVPKGNVIDDTEEFGLSWLYDKLPGGQDRNSCSNKPVVECEPLPIHEDPCVQLVDISRFGQCHPLLDPTIYIEWCQKDTCGGYPERACDAIQAYATECLRSGICVDWHSDLCPAEDCAPGQIYKRCNLDCETTCDDIKNANKKKCSEVPTSGCFCPEGKVFLNGTCVKKTECEVCDEAGHHAGETWKPDKCTNCTCIGATLKCETQRCPSQNTICELGLIAIKISSDGEEECCEKFICVPEATSSPSCDPPQKIPCGAGQIMKLDKKPNGCQQFVCQCKPPEECEPIDLTPKSPIIADGLVEVVNRSGCCPVVEKVCKPETCPEPKKCPEFYTAKEVTKPGGCCPNVECLPPEEKCIYEKRYAAAEEGGEKQLNKYERRKILKNINETWQDGPCRTCTCLETAPGSHQPSCSTTECPPLEASSDFPEYVLQFSPIIGECCPKIIRTACKHEGNTHAVGEQWAETPDRCVISRCVATETAAKRVEKRSVVTECDTSCDLGWEYAEAEEGSEECCGGCKPVGCVVDGSVRKIGERWTSVDRCVSYVCLQVNGTVNIQSVVINCPEISEESRKHYVYKDIPVEGECCSKHQVVGCKVGEKEYQVGETWPSPDGNKCKTISCIRNDQGEVSKQESIETCKKDCKKGWKYQESTSSCCGECISIACIVDGELRQPYENWTSTDGCTIYSCEKMNDQFIVVSQQETCPSLEDCPPENIYKKGCCKYCNITQEDQGECRPEQLPTKKSIGIIKQQRAPHGFCTNSKPIQGFTECTGVCQSSTSFNSKLGTHESKCSCCRAVTYDSIVVELVCEDGFKFDKQIAVPSSCACEEGCSTTTSSVGDKTKVKF